MKAKSDWRIAFDMSAEVNSAADGVFLRHEKCDFCCEIVTSDGLRNPTRLNEHFMQSPQNAPGVATGKHGAFSEQRFVVCVEQNSWEHRP